MADGAVTAIRADTLITLGPKEFDGPAAVIVKDRLIQGVLPAAELDSADCDEVVDLGAKVLMPGFVDPHAHAEVAAKAAYSMVDVRAPGCSTVGAVLDALRHNLDKTRDGWLVGQANLFFDQKLADRRFPTRRELDSVSNDIAIAIRAGGHLSILNSRALQLAGIDAAYEPADYSITGKPAVHRDATGEPTGVVTEMDKLLPFPGLDRRQAERAVETGIRELFTANGVTTIGEISESLTEGLELYDAAISAGRMSARIHIYLWTPGTVTLEQACEHRHWANLTSDPDRLRIQGVKAFADGGYSAARAALSRPYAHGDGHNCGEIALSTAEIVELARRTQAAGLQLAVHANGDRAQFEVCHALASMNRKPGGPRIRIEHAGNFVPDYLALTSAWKAAGIVPVPQPVFIYNFAEFIPDYVGEYARQRQFPLRRLIDDRWPVSGSSDVWVGSEIGQTNPFLSIASAVARRTFHGHQLDTAQQVSAYEALRMHTVGGAYALGEEHTRGTLEVGKYADLIALDRDPLQVPADELRGVTVTDVFLAGEPVYGEDQR
jgi:predicted amidohydrolase YtcJ